MNGRYDDIINLPHHTSLTKPRMPMSNRAAQFSPFAALTGYEDAIKETGRLTFEKVELDEDALIVLNRKLQLLIDRLNGKPKVTLSYFIPDARKSGGSYVDVTGMVKKIDNYERLIVLEDGTKIPMDDVIDISVPEEGIV